MDFFMPAERVLYDRSYFFSDEALEEYTAEVADRDGVDIDEVASSAELMDEARWEIDKAIDRDLLDEICNFDSMLQELKRGDDPEHPTEISVVAKGTVERWDRPSRGLVVADSLRSLVSGTGSADALKDCQIDRIIDTNGELHIETSHHDGSAYLDVRLISGVSFDAKGFKLGGEYYAPGKMSTGDFHILLDNLYDSPGVGPCSLPRFAERAYGTARESYRFGETKFDIYKVADSPDRLCHETTMGYDRNADSWSGATIGPDFWTFDGEEAREFAENIGFDRLAARACAQLGIDAPGLKGREALPIPKAVDVAPEPGAQAEAAKAAAGKKLSGESGGGMRI